MKQFTFFTLSFNQERYIIQHLESIKYQIENFGDEYQVHYVICDDSSSDNTILYARKWLEKNKGLFESVNIIVNNENWGTVLNFINGINGIKTRYKSLAADDIFFDNNVFEVIDKNDIVLTPIISFDDNNEVHYNFLDNKYLYYLLYRKNTSIIKKIKKDLTYYYPLKTPGIFYNINIFSNEEIINFLRPYKLIEDLPTWIYLTRCGVGYKCAIDIKPYVLYRKGVGVSFNLNNDSPFMHELQEIKKKYGLNKTTKYGKWLNPYRYMMHINERIIGWYANIYYKRNNDKIDFAKIQERATKHLEMISQNANDFIRMYC